MPGTPTPSASSRAGRPRPGRNRRVLAVIVLTAAVVTAALSVTLGRGTPPGGTTAPATVSTPEAQEPANPELLALARRDTADPLALGSPDAPVVLIEYSDFQCPFCGRFARETKPALVRDYVDKGILRIEWRNFPVFGAESDQAARAGWAAGQQDRFWQLHDEAYAEPRRRNAGDFSEDNFLAMARKAGVEDLARFEKDMASDAAHQADTRDSDEGYGIGVTSTPAFLINGRPVLGAQPTDVFTDVIDEAAEQARQQEDGDECPGRACRLPRRPPGPPQPLLGAAAAGLLRLLLHQPYPAPGPHGTVLCRPLSHPGATGRGRLLRRTAAPRRCRR